MRIKIKSVSFFKKNCNKDSFGNFYINGYIFLSDMKKFCDKWIEVSQYEDEDLVFINGYTTLHRNWFYTENEVKLQKLEGIK